MIENTRARRVFAWKPTEVDGTSIWLESYFVEEEYGRYKVFFDAEHPHRFHSFIGWHETRRWLSNESCGNCDHCSCQ